MKWTLSLGRIAGIKLNIHWTFFILLAWVFVLYYREQQSLNDGLVGVVFISAIFICVILHELGHALTARKFGFKTKNITLLPIGGLANMERLPDKPKEELLVAIAGPLVNVAIFFLIYAYLIGIGGLPTMEELNAIRDGKISLSSGKYFLFNVMIVNVVLVVFNLLPAFPMDGGRVLRALLSFKMKRSKATRIAARLGQFLAIVFVLLGITSNIWLVFIGIFVFLGAGGEAALETSKNILAQYKMEDVLMTSISSFSVNDPISKAVKLLLDSQQKDFIIKENEEIVGILSRQNIIEGLSKFGESGKISEVVDKNFLKVDIKMELKEMYQKLLSSKHALALVFEDDDFKGIIDKENVSELIAIDQVGKPNHPKMI